MSMSVDGLVSGMDTTALISQLLAAEGAPKTALEKRLSTTELAASAYRTVNTMFAAVRAAAENALKPEAWTPVKATSSATTVSVSASNGALPSSLTFKVDRLATSHSIMSREAAGVWTSAESPYGAAEIEVLDENAAPLTPKITVGGTGTLADAAAAINGATDLKLSASVVQLDSGEAALRVVSRETGLASKFSFAGAPGTPTQTTIGVDAQISIGTDNTVVVTSKSNTFDSVLPGTTFTVSDQGPAAITVNVARDPQGVAATMQSLVDAVNKAISNVRENTNNSKGSTARLRGDFSVSQLAGQLLDAVSSAVGIDGSPAQVGFQLSKDPKNPQITFDKTKFLAALEATPALASRMVAGTPAGTDGDGNPVPAVTGLAQRLLAVAKRASDSATGSLVKLAEGQDSIAKDIGTRIEAWDLRLAKRKEMLTRQFTAMETALSSLRNQSTWLAGQINSLPSYG